MPTLTPATTNRSTSRSLLLTWEDNRKCPTPPAASALLFQSHYLLHGHAQPYHSVLCSLTAARAWLCIFEVHDNVDVDGLGRKEGERERVREGQQGRGTEKGGWCEGVYLCA